MKLRAASFAAIAAAILLLAPVPQSLSAQSAASLSPDTAEIESVGAASVVFVNYEGPESRIDSLAEIKGLGTALGKAMPAGGGATSAGDARYRVIRAVDPSVKDGLDADILILGPGAQVDHIRNLRWIIAGYLVAAWGYAEKDAYTLATFITIYDAVHRGDIKYFTSKYKAVVQKELAPETAGLALSYTEWAGKSRIVVPLSAGAAAGKLGAVDTGAVSDKAVTESLQTQPDKGVPDRQALVDVKEREAAQKQAELDKQKADLAAAEKKLADDKAKAEADRAALEAAKAAAAKPAPAGTASSAPAAASTGAAAAAPGAGASSTGAAPAADLTTKEAAVKAEEAQVAAGTAAVAAKKADVAAGEAAVASKQAEAAADRKAITADQKQVIAAQVAAKGEAAAAGVYLVLVSADTNHLGQIVFVDTDKGTAIRSSRINTLHLRSLAELPDAFVAVSGLEGKPGGVKLVKLDKTSLESVAQSASDMFPDGFVLVSSGSIYAIAKADDGQYYAARFAAADLAEQARSKDAVAPYSLLREASGSIAVQAQGGAFLLLKPDTLEKVKELRP